MFRDHRKRPDLSIIRKHLKGQTTFLTLSVSTHDTTRHTLPFASKPWARIFPFFLSSGDPFDTIYHRDETLSHWHSLWLIGPDPGITLSMLFLPPLPNAAARRLLPRYACLLIRFIRPTFIACNQIEIRLDSCILIIDKTHSWHPILMHRLHVHQLKCCLRVPTQPVRPPLSRTASLISLLRNILSLQEVMQLLTHENRWRSLLPTNLDWEQCSRYLVLQRPLCQ